MSSLAENLTRISAEISACCEKYRRAADSVKLVAVGKKHPKEMISELAELGQRDFGENYLQEALEKIHWCQDKLGQSADSLCWHFIGHIQSRKCREIAENFHWVHTVESIKVANRLNQYRANQSPLNILIQINIDDEPTKSGISSEQLIPLAKEIALLGNLRLRGLMIIPKATTQSSDPLTEQREVFRRCAELLTRLKSELPEITAGLDQLSMGMTSDMEAAIAEGATMVRIGTALFGARPVVQEAASV